jgi:hypothetical protein
MGHLRIERSWDNHPNSITMGRPFCNDKTLFIENIYLGKRNIPMAIGTLNNMPGKIKQILKKYKVNNHNFIFT